jgi:hypothetical protein
MPDEALPLSGHNNGGIVARLVVTVGHSFGVLRFRFGSVHIGKAFS